MSSLFFFFLSLGNTYIVYHDHIIHVARDRVTKQCAKNKGGEAKAKPNARNWHVRAKPLFIGFTGSGPPQKATGIAPLKEVRLAQIEGVAKWKLRRRYCLLRPAARRTLVEAHVCLYRRPAVAFSGRIILRPLNNEYTECIIYTVHISWEVNDALLRIMRTSGSAAARNEGTRTLAACFH